MVVDLQANFKQVTKEKTIIGKKARTRIFSTPLPKGDKYANNYYLITGRTRLNQGPGHYLNVVN